MPPQEYGLTRDQDYIAVVPDLKGCSAFGETPEEALQEVLVAKELWLEAARERGYEIPEPPYQTPEPAERPSLVKRCQSPDGSRGPLGGSTHGTFR